jgi:hypothetical protein
MLNASFSRCEVLRLGGGTLRAPVSGFAYVEVFVPKKLSKPCVKSISAFVA